MRSTSADALRSRLGGAAAHVRPMRERDLPAVVAIEERSYPRPWPEAVFRAQLGRDIGHYVVARRRGRTVGYGGLLVQAGDGHITTVAVHPDERRTGVGRRLVLALLEIARSLGLDGVTLEVRPGNTAARRLYERFGFAVEGRRPGYYADTGEDALILWLGNV